MVRRTRSATPVALVAALALVVVSVACVVSCFAVQTASMPQPMPPCHHHGASSCAPLLLTGELPQSAVTASVVVLSFLSVPPAPIARFADQPASVSAVSFASPPELPAQQHSVLRI